MVADVGDRVVTQVAGEEVHLLAARALFWPRARRLYLSDLHLGKADAFRRAGIGLPSGGTAHDLARLDAALAATAATSVWILGDVLHGAVYESAWWRTWHEWRAARGAVRFAALSGNHDRALATADLHLDLLGDAYDDGPFALRHEPTTVDGLHVLSGHLHPCIGLPGLGPRRWPVFWLQPRTTILPAFSQFTGGCHVEASRADGLVVCADGAAAWVRRPRDERVAGSRSRRA